MTQRPHLFLCTAALLFAGTQIPQAAVMNFTCESINGQTVNDTFGVAEDLGQLFTIDLAGGDTLTINDTPKIPSAGSTPSHVEFRNGDGEYPTGFTPFTYTVPGSETTTIEVDVVVTPTNDIHPLEAIVTCTSGTAPPPPPPEPVGEVDIVPLVTGLAQSTHDAFSTGSRLALGRHQGGQGIAVTRNSGFFGTRNQEGGKAGWAYASARSFSGNADGHAMDLLLGADFEAGQNFYLGAMIGWGRIDITHAGNDQEGEALTYGIYGGQNLERLNWSAFLATARPDYRSGTQEFSTKRVSFGATLEAILPGKTGVLYPYAQISGWREEVPDWAGAMGQDIRRTTATIGARQEWQAFENGMEPWAGFGLDYVSRESRVHGKENFLRPRLSAGVSQSFDNGGELNLGLDVNWLEKDTRSLGLTLDYTLRF